MKKIVSLVLALVLCTALAIPAMAIDGYSNGATIPSGQHDGVWVYDNCNVTIDGAVILTSEGSFRLFTNTTLTIKEGGSLSGTAVVCPSIYENSKIVLKNGAWIKIEFYSNFDANNFEQLLNASEISYKRNDLIIMAGNVPTCVHKNLKTVCVDCGEVISTYSGSTLSEGNLAIITAVAGVAVGFLAAMFIFKKKKKTAVAGGAESDEE